MKNMTLVMLENKQGYGERLAAFISRQADSPFNVHLYFEHPIGDEQWGKADVILMTSSLKTIYGERMNDEKVMILDEEGRGSEEQKIYVYKYQSAVQIYGEILKFCADMGNNFVPGGDRKGKKWTLTGIYTPVSSEKMTKKMLELCGQLGEKQKTLYLNMEQVTCLNEWLEGNGRKEGISEMIYYIKQRQDNMGTRLGTMVIQDKFDYLMPAAIPAEIAELNGDDWQFCLEQLRYGTAYEQVIFDFGSMLPPVILMEASDRWIVIQDGTEWEQKLIERFVAIACRMAGDTFKERILKIGEVMP